VRFSDWSRSGQFDWDGRLPVICYLPASSLDTNFDVDRTCRSRSQSVIFSPFPSIASGDPLLSPRLKIASTLTHRRQQHFRAFAWTPACLRKQAAFSRLLESVIHHQPSAPPFRIALPHRPSASPFRISPLVDGYIPDPPRKRCEGAPLSGNRIRGPSVNLVRPS